MVCMAGLQVFIVRFFFQVCCPSGAREFAVDSGANSYLPGSEKGIRVNDWALDRLHPMVLAGYWENKGLGESKFCVLLHHHPDERGNRSLIYIQMLSLNSFCDPLIYYFLDCLSCP
jgi:hypothetical protein